jgi:hypothetical protein
MRALYAVIMLVALLVLALVIVARAGSQSPIRLTSGARTLFASWMVNHPKAREREQQHSGVRDVLKDTERFFEIELREPEHADVARAVSASGGIVDVAAMGRWIVENSDETHRNLA